MKRVQVMRVMMSALSAGMLVWVVVMYAQIGSNITANHEILQVYKYMLDIVNCVQQIFEKSFVREYCTFPMAMAKLMPQPYRIAKRVLMSQNYRAEFYIF